MNVTRFWEECKDNVHLIHSVRLELGSLLLSVALQGSSTLKNISRPLQVRAGYDLKKLQGGWGEYSDLMCSDCCNRHMNKHISKTMKPSETEVYLI